MCHGTMVLPFSPPTSSEWLDEQREFADRWQRLRNFHRVVNAVSAVFVGCNVTASAILFLAYRDWLAGAVFLVWALLSMAACLLKVRLIEVAWWSAMNARVETGKAHELTQQWRTLYLEVAGRQDG